MTQPELSDLLRLFADKAELVKATLQYGNTDAVMATINDLYATLKAKIADGTVDWFINFCRSSADRTWVLAALLKVFGGNQATALSGDDRKALLDLKAEIDKRLWIAP